MKISMAEHFGEFEYEYREDPHTDVEVVHEDDQVIIVADHTGHELAEWATDFNMTGEDRDAFWNWNYDLARDLTDHDWVAVDPVVFDKLDIIVLDLLNSEPERPIREGMTERDSRAARFNHTQW